MVSLAFAARFNRFRPHSSLGSGAKLSLLIASLVTSLIGMAGLGMTAEAVLVEYGVFSRSISTTSLGCYASTGSADGTLKGLIDQLNSEQPPGLRDALQTSRNIDIAQFPDSFIPRWRSGSAYLRKTFLPDRWR